jgi:hypothetical protein
MRTPTSSATTSIRSSLASPLTKLAVTSGADLPGLRQI